MDLRILAAKGLLACDTGGPFSKGKSDPFVQVQVLPGPHEPATSKPRPVFKTEVVKKSLDPTWSNAHARFELGIRDAPVVRLEVVDWDAASSNDPMGSVTLRLEELCPEAASALSSSSFSTEALDRWLPVEPDPKTCPNATGEVHVILSVARGGRDST